MQNNHISYIEFKTKDIEVAKSFYNEVFGWVFLHYGPDYASFKESGIYGGFERTEGAIQNGVLVVLFHENLNEVKDKVIQAGGKISVDIFEFPGGKRFHFLDPSGNELAVWSEL